jgi:hypothetical protein
MYHFKISEGNSLFASIATLWIWPFPAFFSKNAWKPSNLKQIIAPEKVCPSVEQTEIDIDRALIENGKYTLKWTCSTHGLYIFWKENRQILHVFSTKLAFVQFYGNFMISFQIKLSAFCAFLCIPYLNALVRIPQWTHWYFGARWQ